MPSPNGWVEAELASTTSLEIPGDSALSFFGRHVRHEPTSGDGRVGRVEIGADVVVISGGRVARWR